ncbi:MAG: hypothetical protein KKC68_04965, partial [Candidatus Thermoplasmatota archaeon]|nr:hypothetical protein [Candidatus Thermoplasmatota archaeon]
FCKSFWFLYVSIRPKYIDYVKIYNSIVVVSDVSEEVTSFFVAESFDIFYEPFSEVFARMGV